MATTSLRLVLLQVKSFAVALDLEDVLQLLPQSHVGLTRGDAMRIQLSLPNTYLEKKDGILVSFHHRLASRGARDRNADRISKSEPLEKASEVYWFSHRESMYFAKCSACTAQEPERAPFGIWRPLGLSVIFRNYGQRVPELS
jgi:hypothetical protein